MTIRAYSELYLRDAQILLANAFDYALNDCKLSPDWFGKIFAASRAAREIERGNPAYVSGKAAEEIVGDLLSAVFPGEKLPPASIRTERSPAYWAGWALAYYQWVTAKRFKTIFACVPLSEILTMYRVYHEMDILRFVEDMEQKCNAFHAETKLKQIREARGLSQSELATLSGVKKRSVQLYEQRVNDIDRAQAHTLLKLASVLGCDVEDLLEEPEKKA